MPSTYMIIKKCDGGTRSLQAIPSRAAEIPISKGPHSPLKLCAFVRVSDARDRGWGGDVTGDGGWGGVRGLQVNSS
jgi:hypothetical protein